MFHYETLVQWLEGIRRRLGEAMPHRPVVQKVYVDRSPCGMARIVVVVNQRQEHYSKKHP